MKKFICSVLAIIIVIMSISSVATVAYGSTSNVLNINTNSNSHRVSQYLYGISLDDSSYSCDGGLVSNLINNNSFEYSKSAENSWIFKNINPVLSNSDSINANNPTYEMLTIKKSGEIKNTGFSDIYKNNSYKFNTKKQNTPSICFKKGVEYNLSFYIKNVDFAGNVYAYLDSKGNTTNQVKVNTNTVSKNQWSKVDVKIKASETSKGSIAIKFIGNGSLQFDFATLVPSDSYGYGTNEFKYVTLRNDLFTTIQNLNPSFIKFSCDGGYTNSNVDNLFSWKNTIGEIQSRPQSANVNADNDNGNCYNNSNFMGFHEYFQLCKDLKATPIPTVNVGITNDGKKLYKDYLVALDKLNMNDTQWNDYLINQLGFDKKDKKAKKAIENYTNHINSLKVKSQSDFDKWVDSVALKPNTDEFNNYVQDVLDLIEYANGDSQTTYWGSLRNANGQENSFNLKYIALGSENYGDVYFRNLDALYKAIKEKYPDIQIISACGTDYDGTDFDNSFNKISSNYNDSIVNESYFAPNNYLINHNDRYDSYNRDGNKVFVSKFAVNDSKISKPLVKNNMFASVEESSFAIGFERNSDIVSMTSYSPTFAKINANNCDVSMVWFDGENVLLTPSYYSQMMFANNVGNEYLDTAIQSEKENKDIFQSVTIDRDKQIVYIKLVNSGKKQTVAVNVDGVNNINTVSNLHMSNKYKDAYNKMNKYTVAPQSEKIKVNSNSFSVQMDKNSVNVVSVAYGENKGQTIYKLPKEATVKTKKYTPTSVKTVRIILGAVILIALIYALYKLKNNKKSKGNRK